MNAPDDLAPMIHVNPGTGCWEWQGYIMPAGYGQAHRNDRVHVRVWVHHNGPVPKGLSLDHLCRVRHCCNPEHLEPVTARLNNLRGVGFAATNKAKYRCAQGHPLIGSNAYLRPDRLGRLCRQCRGDSNVRFDKAHRSVLTDRHRDFIRNRPVMPRTRKQRLADAVLRESLDVFVARHRADGWSWRQMADRLTELGVSIHGETLRYLYRSVEAALVETNAA